MKTLWHDVRYSLRAPVLGRTFTAEEDRPENDLVVINLMPLA